MTEATDFRFDIRALPEPEIGCTHLVIVIAHRGLGDGTDDIEEIERLYTDDPYGYVEAARERQAMPDLEERLAYYAERGW